MNKGEGVEIEMAGPHVAAVHSSVFRSANMGRRGNKAANH